MTQALVPRLAAAERRVLIERAASQLFAEQGYAKTTVEEIVRAAGVTKPMLYRHFKGKQALCVALLTRARDELVAAPLARFDPAVGGLRDQLPGMLAAWLEHVEQHPNETRMLFTPIHGDPVIERLQGELFSRQAETQAALLREFAPGLTEADSVPLGEALRAALGAVALWRIEHPENDRESAAAALLAVTDGTVEHLRRREVRP